MSSLTFALQALLARHEAYVADAEQDRQRLLARMEELEQDKRHLEEKNKETGEENRKLLDQLEALNLAATTSDSHVQSLTEHVRATESRLERMNGFVNRTESLQKQLSRLEEEQARLHSNLDSTKENERAAVLRWQQAERTIVSLHLQIEQLEREAKRERDRQNEEDAIAERKAALEAQLHAPGLDRASSSKTLPQAKGGNNVISHFVKDILQDNANLQLGIVELRELLENSHEEVERLRVLVAQHADEPTAGAATPTLSAELSMGGTKEYHVHHHYHASPAAESLKTPKGQIHRRPKKTRARLSSGQFTPVSVTSTPRSSISVLKPSSPTSAGAIMSPASITIPRQKARWSMQSNQTGFTSSSSLPSSPSGNSIFDRVFNDAATATDVSRPTSPESNSGLSPRAGNYFDRLEPSKRRKSSQTRVSLDETVASSSQDIPIITPLPKSRPSPLATHAKRNSILSTLDIVSPRHSTIIEEAEGLSPSKQKLALDTDNRDSPTSPSDSSPAPPLKRVASHESIFSVSGMDIHTLPHRPSQRFIGNRIISAPSAGATLSATVLSDASATAVRPSLYRKALNGGDSFSRSYLSGVAGVQRAGEQTLRKKPSMGQKVGGWLYNRWAGSYTEEPFAPTGAATTTVTAAVDARSVSSAAKSMGSQDSAKKIAVPMPRKPRPPGVNQPGPIFGFGPESATPFKAALEPGEINTEVLRESLMENG